MPLAWVWAWALQRQYFEFLVGQIGWNNVTEILEASRIRHDKKNMEQGTGQNNIARQNNITHVRFFGRGGETSSVPQNK